MAKAERHTAADGAELDNRLGELKEAKEAEAQAKDRRLEAEESVLDYGTVRQHLRPGTVYWDGRERELKIEQEVEYKVLDEKKIRAAVPPELVDMMLRPKYEFSKAGYNQIVKGLEALAMVDPEKKALLARITRAYEQYIDVRPCKATLSVRDKA